MTTLNNSAAISSTSGKEKAKEEDIIGGNYRLLRTIGQGTYGKVKLGQDIRSGESVKIKN